MPGTVSRLSRPTLRAGLEPAWALSCAQTSDRDASVICQSLLVLLGRLHGLL